MMAMTTSSSISVNPSRLPGEVLGPEVLDLRASQNIALTVTDRNLLFARPQVLSALRG